MQNNNILLATILSAVILIGWTWLYEKPKAEEFKRYQETLALQEKENKANDVKVNEVSNIESKKEFKELKATPKTSKILMNQESALKESAHHRIGIVSDKLIGSINLKGAKFDNLHLSEYKESIDEDADTVTLFAPVNSKERYFADFGWASSDSNIDLPGVNTIWHSEDTKLTPSNDITLSWSNRQKVLFVMEISMDENYMFHIKKSVKNLSKKTIKLASYGRVNRLLRQEPTSNYILHEGPMGVFDGLLTEIQYDDLPEENNQKFESKKTWLGITDKYWLAAIIADDQPINTTFSHSENSNGHIYDAGFIGDEVLVNKGETIELNHKLFAGAKDVSLLDDYGKEYDIELFDRAVDFGWYYFLTKPFFFILKFFNGLLGNYGLAILAITVLVKAAMLPLASKSYSAMAKIKKLHPNIEEIRKNNKDSKMQMNKEIMELYKREKVNPASGCLPMLIQIPVFFSLYKVLFTTIDMRHQPFYGWIKDLSAPDPTSIFNLFGLLPFEINSGILMIGIWPILMGLTMILQQKLGPKISDPAQAKVMKILPFVLIFIFAAFPAGLLIYWTWNNILSVTQQYIITKRVEKSA